VRLVDSHAHLQAEAFAADADLVLRAARLAGVERLLAPGWDLPSSRDSVALAVRWPAAPSQGRAPGEWPPWWRQGWKWSEIATISSPAASARTAKSSSSEGPNCSADAL